MGEELEPRRLSDTTRDRLAAELARLRERRRRLEVEVKSDRGMVGDHGDAAEAIQRADELALLDEQIIELDRILRTGRGPLLADEAETLPAGTEVTLRFLDGTVATMHVISIVEETPAGGEAETLTAGSPLGRALVGHKPGDVITYTTPQGENRVELLDVKFPA
ncbi:GreA/GreB family elongation factor [Mycobacterium sp. SM1]|uniref:GreA/GreB family elongation factor n=1 Tax=Mycobacterium sp. SM1 TaxID=2816243 RepID=UPI001BCE50CC|nr:GreA/GreB family elongation factor [Mycobacterium sp. SM1]MBS4727920.1 GreA/GreB family elongation factor [Mycobacterium sp. SM1]